MPADECPEDDDPTIRKSYNFAPGYHGLVYRAEISDEGITDELASRETRYKLQGMKWGLVPFWTKRSPDYGSTMRTINCRDDSLARSGGMWKTMKQKKRCIVVCEGFFEWYKKNNGDGSSSSKEKMPHFIKRKDGRLMLFAGLWDCVKYEGAEEKLYTYTIITTDSNKQLAWLHDRMPVILEAGSDQVKLWLDPGRVEWSNELQGLLRPYGEELECYAVDKSVGKVGNNSASFVVPIDSKDNKKNISTFFAKATAKKEQEAEPEDHTWSSPKRNRAADDADDEDSSQTPKKVHRTEHAHGKTTAKRGSRSGASQKMTSFFAKG